MSADIGPTAAERTNGVGQVERGAPLHERGIHGFISPPLHTINETAFIIMKLLLYFVESSIDFIYSIHRIDNIY